MNFKEKLPSLKSLGISSVTIEYEIAALNFKKRRRMLEKAYKKLEFEKMVLILKYWVDIADKKDVGEHDPSIVWSKSSQQLLLHAYKFSGNKDKTFGEWILNNNELISLLESQEIIFKT